MQLSFGRTYWFVLEVLVLYTILWSTQPA